MKLSKEQFEERKAVVRSLMVRDPDISSRAIAEATGWSLEHAWKMKKVVIEDRTKHLNTEVHKEVAQFAETINELCKECWSIIQNKGVQEHIDPKSGEVIGILPAVSDSDKLRAIEILARNLKMLLDVKFDSGIFKKQLGQMQIESFSVFVDLVKQYGNIPVPPRNDQAGAGRPDRPTLPS